MGHYEQPKYQTVSSQDTIEIRDYSPIIVAQVTTQGERKEAIRAGFKLLADYIFGNNLAKGSIEMTAPVTQQKSQEIAMTAPVTQQAKGSEWLVHFTMPSQYTIDTLPKPNNKVVMLKEVPTKRFAVIQFSGMMTQSNLDEHEKELQVYLSQNNMTALAEPIYAFYNPPWTLPFMRRNEVMVEIAKQ